MAEGLRLELAIGGRAIPGNGQVLGNSNREGTRTNMMTRGGQFEEGARCVELLNNIRVSARLLRARPRLRAILHKVRWENHRQDQRVRSR